MDAIKWSLAKSTLLLMMIVAMLSFTSNSSADEKVDNNRNATTQQIGVKSPATDLWRAVRNREFDGSQSVSSTSQVKSMGAATFINADGQKWRNFRMEQLVPYAAYLLGGVLLVLALFRLIRGKIKIKTRRSGKKILRFSPLQRFVHWSVAILFVILGITGILLTFGKSGLVPIIGSKAFGSIAGGGKLLHDYLGPVFGIMLLVMLFTFIKGNFANWTDIKWFFKGGGMFGNHASAGRYNGGEKVWFWLAILVGAVVIVSGLILDFPFFNQSRDDLQLSHWVHAIASIGLLAVSFGHIFMGTIAMEGSYEAMRTGYCDENWAKDHHDLWYADLEKQGVLNGSLSSAMLKESSTANTPASPTTQTSSDSQKASLIESQKNAPNGADNFKKIEGIGPKIEEILKAGGITTFSKLSKTHYDDLKALLNEAGPRYKMHNPTTWPQQAALADDGAWKELSEFQGHLLSSLD